MCPYPGKGAVPSDDRWTQRLAELGVRWRLFADEAKDQQDTSVALRERVKELNCLYAISQLVEKTDGPFEEFLAAVVDVLPPSWQFPEVACARIIADGRTYESLYFKSSPWRIGSPFDIPGKPAGEITVFYSEVRPAADEGPFLKEERYLIEAVAERIGHIASRKLTESRLAESNRQLATERTALREANTALRLVLARIEDEKREIQQTLIDNVEKILMPIVHELALIVSPEHRDYLMLLQDSLEQVTSTFTRKLSVAYRSLTATELRICDLIRNGMSSKDIAELRHISVATVSRHREHIRRKLGITNAKVNLETFLQRTD